MQGPVPCFRILIESCFGYDACANLELFLMRLPYLKKIYAGHVISKRFHGSGFSSPCYSRNGHIAKAMNANNALAHWYPKSAAKSVTALCVLLNRAHGRTVIHLWVIVSRVVLC